MSFIKIPYDNTKLDAIRIRLENHARLNDPIFYCVVIDDLEVIPRTADASVFSTIDELIGPNTKYISISEYIGQTRNRKTTCFVIDTKLSEQSGLNGTENGREDQQQYISRQIEQAAMQRDYATLQSEHAKLKQVSDALLDKCDRLEEENAELKKLQDENAQQNSFFTLASDLISRFAPAKTENPLSGTPNEKAQEAAEPKGEGQMHVAISEEEYKNYKYFVEQFQNFDQAQQGLISKLIDLFNEHPELIEEIFVITFQKTQDGNQKD